MEEQPAAYQQERAERFGCSQRGISDALKRLRISRKKTVQHPKTDEASRDIFRANIKEYHDKNKSIIYVDESEFAHDMPRTHGYAPVDVRCFGKHEWNPKPYSTTNSWVWLWLTEALMPTCFVAWLRHELLLELPNKSVVVTFHKSDDIKAAIISCGHELEFLPIYLPDFRYIEHTQRL